jgi:DNA repair protein RadC
LPTAQPLSAFTTIHQAILAPSKENRGYTARLIQAGTVLGIRILDHIICGESEYFSFADSGCLQ